MGAEDLSEFTRAIFQEIEGDVYPANLTFDCIHRALAHRFNDPERPRDVICGVHLFFFFTRKWGTSLLTQGNHLTETLGKGRGGL